MTLSSSFLYLLQLSLASQYVLASPLSSELTARQGTTIPDYVKFYGEWFDTPVVYRWSSTHSFIRSQLHWSGFIQRRSTSRAI